MEADAVAEPSRPTANARRRTKAARERRGELLRTGRRRRGEGSGEWTDTVNPFGETRGSQTIHPAHHPASLDWGTLPTQARSGPLRPRLFLVFAIPQVAEGFVRV